MLAERALGNRVAHECKQAEIAEGSIATSATHLVQVGKLEAALGGIVRVPSPLVTGKSRSKYGPHGRQRRHRWLVIPPARLTPPRP